MAGNIPQVALADTELGALLWAAYQVISQMMRWSLKDSFPPHWIWMCGMTLGLVVTETGRS